MLKYAWGVALGVVSTVAFGQSVDNYNPRTVLRRPVRAITNPTIVPVDQAGLSDNELIIGVEIDGHARAYPINMLTGPKREIINDELNGVPIAATW